MNSRSALDHLTRGLRPLARDLGFTEGPVADQDTHVLVASMTRGTVYRVPLGGGPAAPVVEVGGAPNGLARASDGAVLVAQSGEAVITSRSALPVVPSIQAVAVTAQSAEVAVRTEGGVHAPSDCVVGPDGRLWFTDPGDHVVDVASANGHVRALDLETHVLETVAEGLSFPNGLAFSAAGDRLYVAETALARVRRFAVEPRGRLVHDGWTATLPSGRPDGLALDAAGWLWVAGSSGDNVVAFDDDATPRIDWHLGTGQFTTSICFAGPELSTLVITSPKGGRVLATPALHPGLPLPVHRAGALAGTRPS